MKVKTQKQLLTIGNTVRAIGFIQEGEMKDITAEQFRKWVQEAKEKGMSPDRLIIPRPKSKTINICGTEVHITPGTYLYSFDGIDIILDDRLPKDRAYLIDSKTMVIL